MSKSSLTITTAALALATTFAAHSAGLGRLTVLSPLGAPLNAEIEVVSLQQGEEDGLTARIASAEAFRLAGIEPTAQLRTIRFTVVQRAGKPVIRVTSTQPINEPFVDLLVELEWKGGRLVREYTFLLDPPEVTGRQAIAATPAAPAPQQQAAAQPAPEPRVEAAPAPRVDAAPASAPEAAAPAYTAPASAPAPVAKPLPAGAATHEVRRGDTLGEIARANLPPGVSLNQMLVAIYRANQDAFIRENINLVRAGRILNLPSAEDASAIQLTEATRLVQSHRAEWDEYRSRLAAAPSPAEAASGQRAVAGRIEAKPDATPPAAPQDRVRLSKAEPRAAGADRAARADDAVARERELKEAQSRVTDLEKNVADLQKLLELKNQQFAELEKKAAPAKPAAVAPAPVPAPAPEAKKAEPAPVSAAPAPAAKKAEPAPQPKKAEPAPQAKKAETSKSKAKAAPASAPSLLDEFLDNPTALAGLGAVIVLLLGYFAWSWRRKKATQAKFSDSVLGTAGGSAASLSDSAPATGGRSGSQASVSQASGMEAEEVDPIAEADVYMAYGRDAQAEEILREALQKDSGRIPVHAKLLEIYAKRSDIGAFEQTAVKLKNLTNGVGPEWEKAAALGRSIDARNGLYGGAGAASTVAAVATGAAAAMPVFAVAGGAPAIDFDIGAAASSPSMITTDIPLDGQPQSAPPSNLSSVDFDLGAGTLPPGSGMAAIKQGDADATVTSLDLDLNLDSSVGEKIASLPALAPAAESASGIDFDLNLDEGDKQVDASAPSMDLSSISLDLGSAGEPGVTPSNDPKWQEVATKLDLAKAYEEMGDKDGARELLGEVMKDGDAAQKGQAQQLLTKLG